MPIIDTVEGAANSFASFLNKHAAELESVVSVLGTLTHALPLQTDDKTRVTDILDGLNKSVQNIQAAANDLTGAPVTVRKSDVDAAIADFFKTSEAQVLIANAIAAEQGDKISPADAVGNANG